ncbi:hypothetical protein D3C80_1109520 [compost metagenome]
MPRPIAGVTQPVQLHTEGLQVANGGGVLKMTTQQACRGKAEALARCGQGVQVIGMRTAQADDAGGLCLPGQTQVFK